MHAQARDEVSTCVRGVLCFRGLRRKAMSTAAMAMGAWDVGRVQCVRVGVRAGQGRAMRMGSNTVRARGSADMVRSILCVRVGVQTGQCECDQYCACVRDVRA